MNFEHKSVMLDEVLNSLDVKPNGIYLDCTLGGAGHAAAIGKKLDERGLLIGIDQDDDAISAAKDRLKNLNCGVKIFRANFSELDKILDGLCVYDVGQSTENVLACTIERDGDVFIPNGSFEIKAGDIISVVAPRKAVKIFLEKMSPKAKQVKNTLIVGGGNSGFYLAKQLLHLGINVKIIEKNKARCDRLGALLPKAVIIHGDGSDEELLKEEGIQEVESFVPLTGSDEENILLTLYARKVSKTEVKTITKINRITFSDVIDSLDLGSVIFPRYITAEAITAYVRAKSASRSSSIETLSYMFDHRVEAIEFKVDEDYKGVTNIPLSELNLKKDLLIAFINRQGKIIIPSGSDMILPGDTFMIVTTHTGFVQITDIINVR